MSVWHAIKGAQKGTIKTTCSQCGKKIRIYPDEPKLCCRCREKIKLDKEAQEKIAEIIYETLGEDTAFNKEGGYFPNADLSDDIAGEILKTMKGLGYRKPPEDKPPLLSNEGIEKVSAIARYDKSSFRNVAHAQREVDIKFYS